MVRLRSRDHESTAGYSRGTSMMRKVSIMWQMECVNYFSVALLNVPSKSCADYWTKGFLLSVYCKNIFICLKFRGQFQKQPAVFYILSFFLSLLFFNDLIWHLLQFFWPPSSYLFWWNTKNILGIMIHHRKAINRILNANLWTHKNIKKWTDWKWEQAGLTGTKQFPPRTWLLTVW